MRLIDADEFIKNVVKYSHQSTKTIGQALADTPTVDAIPMSVIEGIKAELEWRDKLGEGLIYVSGVLKIIDKHIKETQIERTGYWKKTCFVDKYICSQCHKEYDIHYIKAMGMKYCPNCGCRMQESEDKG